MSFLLWVYLSISAICFIAMTLTSLDFAYKFRNKYPNVKYPKQSSAAKILSWVKNIIASLLPLFNIAMILVILFSYEELEKRTLLKLYMKCMEEKYD